MPRRPHDAKACDQRESRTHVAQNPQPRCGPAASANHSTALRGVAAILSLRLAAAPTRGRRQHRARPRHRSRRHPHRSEPNWSLARCEQAPRALSQSDSNRPKCRLSHRPQAEDIHHFVELELTKEIGDLALKLHTGRSRNEQIATDMRLFVRDAIDNTLAGLNALALRPHRPRRISRRSRHAQLHPPPARRARPRRPLAPRLRQHDRARHSAASPTPARA